jgi:hypothetical protein
MWYLRECDGACTGGANAKVDLVETSFPGVDDFRRCCSTLSNQQWSTEEHSIFRNVVKVSLM